MEKRPRDRAGVALGAQRRGVLCTVGWSHDECRLDAWEKGVRREPPPRFGACWFREARRWVPGYGDGWQGGLLDVDHGRWTEGEGFFGRWEMGPCGIGWVLSPTAIAMMGQGRGRGRGRIIRGRFVRADLIAGLADGRPRPP